MNAEKQTVAAMIRMYCRAHHSMGKELCEECRLLQLYAFEQIGSCPFGTEKPVCSRCSVHCYAPNQRDRIKRVMRFSGPRMLARHPLLALRHLLRLRRSVLP